MIDISGWRKRQIAIEQKAENAREMGLDYGCSECGVGGGYALYCVACAEKIVPDIPTQPIWVGLTHEEFIHYSSLAHFDVVDEIENLLKEKNMTGWRKRGGGRG
jgi:hypothetical protein